MKVNAIINVTKKTKSKATIKILSAIFSYLILKFSFAVRMDKKEKKQLAIRSIHAIPVISSIFDTSLNFDILRDVRTMRQNPNKLDDVFRICCVLVFAISNFGFGIRLDDFVSPLKLTP